MLDWKIKETFDDCVLLRKMSWTILLILGEFKHNFKMYKNSLDKLFSTFVKFSSSLRRPLAGLITSLMLRR